MPKKLANTKSPDPKEDYHPGYGTTGIEVDMEVDIDIKSLLSNLNFVSASSEGAGVGRPLFDGKDEGAVIAKLQLAFAIGAKPAEACAAADISLDSFYRYCKRYPEFRDKIECLREVPTLMARYNIFRSLADGNIKIAQWYLERACPGEFTINGAVATTIIKLEKRVEYLQRILVEHDIPFNWYKN